MPTRKTTRGEAAECTATRRSTLGAIAGLAAASAVPAVGATSPADRVERRSTAQSGAGDGGEPGIRQGWTRTYEGASGVYCTDVVPQSDGGAFAACPTINDGDYAYAVRAFDVGSDGALTELATIGDPANPDQGYLEPAIADDGEDGVVIAVVKVDGYDGDAEEFATLLVRIDGDGEVAWRALLPSASDRITHPRPVGLVADENGYVVAMDSLERGGAETGIAAVDHSGEDRFSTNFDDAAVEGILAMDLVSIDSGSVFLGARAPEPSASETSEAVFARIGPEGAVDGPTIPSTETSTYPRSLSATDQGLLVVGEELTEAGETTERAWAAQFDAFDADAAAWEAHDVPGGPRLVAGHSAAISDRHVLAGVGDDAPRLLGGPEEDPSSWTTELPSDVHPVGIVPAGTGHLLVLGYRTGGPEWQLWASKLSMPLVAEEIDLSVEPGTITAGESTSLSIETGAYDRGRFEVDYASNGSAIDVLPNGTASFESAGNRTVTANLRTNGNRTVTVERDLNVTEPPGDGGDDSLPGFGLVAGGLGLAGAAALQRFRGRFRE